VFAPEEIQEASGLFEGKFAAGTLAVVASGPGCYRRKENFSLF